MQIVGKLLPVHITRSHRENGKQLKPSVEKPTQDFVPSSWVVKADLNDINTHVRLLVELKNPAFCKFTKPNLVPRYRYNFYS